MEIEEIRKFLGHHVEVEYIYKPEKRLKAIGYLAINKYIPAIRVCDETGLIPTMNEVAFSPEEIYSIKICSGKSYTPIYFKDKEFTKWRLISKKPEEIWL